MPISHINVIYLSSMSVCLYVCLCVCLFERKLDQTNRTKLAIRFLFYLISFKVQIGNPLSFPFSIEITCIELLASHIQYKQNACSYLGLQINWIRKFSKGSVSTSGAKTWDLQQSKSGQSETGNPVSLQILLFNWNLSYKLSNYYISYWSENVHWM